LFTLLTGSDMDIFRRYRACLCRYLVWIWISLEIPYLFMPLTGSDMDIFRRYRTYLCCYLVWIWISLGDTVLVYAVNRFGYGDI